VVVVVVGKEEEGVTYSPVESGRNRRRRETVPAPSGILSIFPLQVFPAHSACCNSAATYIPIHLAQEKFVG
jgi:hypothetical protein